MCHNFKTLLLRNDQTFISISNNQTLLGIHDYQANICARLPLESWVGEIQFNRTIQFLFRDKRFYAHIFLMVTITPQAL